MPEEMQRYYTEYFTETFGQRTGPPAGPNPYDSLLDLPIGRFVTTNYDVEIELALIRARRGTPRDYRLESTPPEISRSFTQRRDFHKELTGFAVAGVPEMRDAVFHCHGRYDDPKSIVATEHDYQKWYLGRDDPEGAA